MQLRGVRYSIYTCLNGEMSCFGKIKIILRLLENFRTQYQFWYREKVDSNFGGPAFNANGECLGMAFQSLNSDSAENIGYVIPTVETACFRRFSNVFSGFLDLLPRGI